MLALGAYADAETEYLSTLDYKYLNQAAESVTLWLRLADLYLEWGDRLYRTPATWWPTSARPGRSTSCS